MKFHELSPEDQEAHLGLVIIQLAMDVRNSRFFLSEPEKNRLEKEIENLPVYRHVIGPPETRMWHHLLDDGWQERLSWLIPIAKKIAETREYVSQG